MVKKFALLLALTFITACATTEKLELKLKSRMGTNVNDLISEIGPPHDTFTKPNGDVMYTWKNRGPATASAVPQNIFSPSHVVFNQNYCDITYTTSKEGLIIDYSFRGNHCKMR
jgi:hypothetical protein